jgi:hypothetical protein
MPSLANDRLNHSGYYMHHPLQNLKLSILSHNLFFCFLLISKDIDYFPKHTLTDFCNAYVVCLL